MLRYGAMGAKEPGGAGAGTRAAEVSIVIPTLNSSTWIGDVVTAWSRALPGAEIVIVDDASEDDTCRAVTSSSTPGLTLIANATRLGQDRSTLIGCETASRPWIVTVDDDVLPTSQICDAVTRAVDAGGITYLSPTNRRGVRRAASTAARWLARRGGMSRELAGATSTRVFPARAVSRTFTQPIDQQLVPVQPRQRAEVAFRRADAGRSRYSLAGLGAVWFAHLRASQADR